jgi:hypothetical protein
MRWITLRKNEAAVHEHSMPYHIGTDGDFKGYFRGSERLEVLIHLFDTKKSQSREFDFGGMPIGG